ncbi:hypothetical protein P7C73_g548, partial [Tremellales sp. Uapishka_1]
MSDREGGPSGDDDLSLPKATVFKLIQEMLPEDLSCSREAKDIMLECCVGTISFYSGQDHKLRQLQEWIKLMATQANACCDESSKKTISPEHIVDALKVGVLFVQQPVAHRVDQQLGYEDFIPEVQESQKDFKQSQKERTRAQPDTNGMTPEELLALQEKLFASSQARFEATQ